MLTGIALVGTLTAAVASWFVHVVRTTNAGSAAPLVASEDHKIRTDCRIERFDMRP